MFLRYLQSSQFPQDINLSLVLIAHILVISSHDINVNIFKIVKMLCKV